MYISPQTWDFIKEHESDDIRILALQAGKYPDIDMSTAVTQIAGKKIAADKIPSWHAVDKIIYSTHLPLEQCSSETTARYKSTIIRGNTLVDLTGGFGIDCAFLSENFKQVTYVERQKDLYDIVNHNFKTLRLNHITLRNMDSVEFLSRMYPVDCIYVDPARRNKQGGKTFLIADCEPDVQQLEDLLLRKASSVWVKLSPMLDLSMAIKTLHSISAVYVVSVKNECKELLLCLKDDWNKEIPVHCINLLKNDTQLFTFIYGKETETDCKYTNDVAGFLYEPNASILKAGGFKSISQRFGIVKLHPNSHLYTSDLFIRGFPGKCFRVLDYGSMKDKQITGNTGKANIVTRNFPFTVVELRKRLKIREGGDIFLFATTLFNNKKVIIRAEKV